MCGALIPARLLSELEKLASDSEAVVEFGIKEAVRLCSELLDGGAPGLHIYTLNKSVQTRPIVEQLRNTSRLKQI